MRKKIMLWMLVICVCTSTIYTHKIEAHASLTTITLGSYAAEKVLLALLALAGVAVEAKDVEFIWDEGGLNTDALINNMMEYSRDLGMSMRTYLGMGAAGATSLMFNRNTWNLFKAWARYKFGTDTSTSTSLGTISKELRPLEAGKPFKVGWVYNNLAGGITLTFEQDMFVFYTLYSKDSNGIPTGYKFMFFPEQRATSSSQIGVTSSVYGNNALVGDTIRNTYYRNGSTLVYLVEFRTGNQANQNFQALDMMGGYPVYFEGTWSNESQPVWYVYNNYMNRYYQNGSLTIDNVIEASPIEGVDEQTATAEGQDIVSLDTVATQEGEDVILEGPLAVALPDAATLEVLLKQLATDEITYQDYVQALGLAAVTTKDTTAEAIRQKEQTITVNPIAGNYTVALDDLFPFCIPFDLFDILNAFEADPVAPEVTISLPVGYDGTDFTWEDYVISLSIFDTVAEVTRIFEYILFCIGLMLLTRKLIEG